MTDTDLTTQPEPAKPAHKVTGKVRAAIDAMVWQGLPRTEAAKAAGISEHGLYKALRKAPVKAHYLAELDTLRLSGKARGIHRMTEIMHQDDNLMAAVNAFKVLNQMDQYAGVMDAAQRSQLMTAPGLVIVVQGGAQPTNIPTAQHQTNNKQLIEHDAVHLDDRHGGNETPTGG